MYCQNQYVPSPFSLAKRKIANNARSLAFIIIVMSIFYIGNMITGIGLLYDRSNQELIENISYFLPSIMTFVTLAVLLLYFITLIVYYIFFFRFASSISNIGISEPIISDTASKASVFIILSLIFDIINGAIFFVGIPYSKILAILSRIFLFVGFYFIRNMFRKFQERSRFKENISNLLLYAAGLLFVDSVLKFVSLLEFNETTLVLFILSLAFNLAGEGLFIIGLFRLAKDIELIIDTSSDQSLAPV